MTTKERDPLLVLRAALSRAYLLEWKPGTFTPAVDGPVDAVLRARVLPLVEALQTIADGKDDNDHSAHCKEHRRTARTALRALTDEAVKP